MTQADLVNLLELSRRKTNELIEAIAVRPDAAAVLGWRPAPGRAHIAWQLMHIAATDDRHLNARMRPGEPVSPDFVRRFAGGSTPDDDVPNLDAIRGYLSDRRQAILGHLRSLRDADLATKPSDQAPWTYEDWFRVLAWHEAHHHGQAHLSYNLYRAENDPAAPKVGH
jgi:hypothetical protein